jgi:hypothetical protein
MNRLLAAAIAPLLLLAACEQKTEAPPAPADQKIVAAPATPPPAEPTMTGFKHDASVDLGGFYFTETAVQNGNWKLTSLDIGPPPEFAKWEKGERSATYAPIFLAFDDITSPTAENELGQTYHTVSFRLLPGSYSADGNALRFQATDARLGEVVLSLVPDVEALKAAKAAGPNGGPLKSVLTGSLEIGGQRIGNISFTYHPGE